VFIASCCRVLDGVRYGVVFCINSPCIRLGVSFFLLVKSFLENEKDKPLCNKKLLYVILLKLILVFLLA
jgi:hypothetical protein